jgi:GT2 family glycosyltransferase/glycosyltransferase involved in cell wall biosynthesis
MDPSRYAALYLAPLPSGPRAKRTGSMPAFDAHFFHLDEGQVERPPLPLTQLYEAGVQCGHTEARDELGRRVAVVDAQLAEFRAVRDKAQGDREQLAAELLTAQRVLLKMQMHTGHVETALAAARARIGELEGSTTWRVTRPARIAGHRAKLALVRMRARWTGARQLPRQAALAYSILRNEGPAALARRVAEKVGRRRGYRPLAGAAFKLEDAIAPLTLATSAVPKVSIVIPAFGDPLLTYTCLKSVAAHTSVAYEAIVIDDASALPLAEALRDVRGVRIERNDANMGFIASSNRGASLAHGELIVFLNNDTIVTPGWLEALLAVFRDHPDAGLAGAKLIYPDGRLQEAGGIVWRDGSAWNFGRNDDRDKPEYNYLREVDYCSGACIAVPRALFSEIGGFDTRYAPAYYEDTDFAFAVRAAGRKVFYQPLATVVHFEGKTSGTDASSGVKRHQVVNQSTFAAKWAPVLEHHRPNGVQPRLEADRNAQHRVLVIDACMLTPDQDSGSVRMQAILEILTSLKCKVTFVADNLEYRQPYVAQLAQRGVEVLFAPYVRSIADLLSERGREFDMVVISRHYIAEKHIAAVRVFSSNALVVFDTVDLHFLREERRAELEGSAAGKSAARAKRDAELALIRRADITLVVSPTEQALLAQLVPASRVVVLSNIHDVQPPGRPFEQREGLVFIGGFQHPPNTDAVLFYAREILPRIRAALPHVKTYIVGSKVPATIKALAADDFVVTGFVPDVTPYFTGCRVSISPLRYGAGVKGKVNLAMSFGLPVVATSVSIEGMFLTPGEDVLVADSPAAFADAIVRLYHDAALWQRLAEGGRDNVRNRFSRDVARSAITRLVALLDAHRSERELA